MEDELNELEDIIVRLEQLKDQQSLHSKVLWLITAGIGSILGLILFR